MKGEKLESPANGCQGRNTGHYFSREGSTRLLGQKPQMQENAVSTMTLDGPPSYGIDGWEPRVLAARTGKIRLTALGKGRYPGVTISNDTLPGLKSVGFWDGAGPQNWGLDAHRNESVAIYFVETG